MLKQTIFANTMLVADTELLSTDVADLGRGLGTLLQRKSGRRINIGRDCRLSSDRLRNALMAGLKSSGCVVTDIGVVPTPVLYYSAFHLKADGAVMITGSHNPPEYNGFKVVSGPTTIHGEQIQEVRHIVENRDFLSGAALTIASGLTPYLGKSPGSSFERRIKVGRRRRQWDGGPVMHQLFKWSNCEVTELFFDMDGPPNHHPDPTVPANLKQLRSRAHRKPTWASPSMAMPTASAPLTKTAR
jgi:phosphomannomutase/phosphoglucomutase